MCHTLCNVYPTKDSTLTYLRYSRKKNTIAVTQILKKPPIIKNNTEGASITNEAISDESILNINKAIANNKIITNSIIKEITPGINKLHKEIFENNTH